MAQKSHLYIWVGILIAVARRKANMTQEALGSRVGLTRTSIAFIETARQRVQLDTLYEIAEVLGTTPFALLPKDIPPPETGCALCNMDVSIFGPGFLHAFYIESKEPSIEDKIVMLCPNCHRGLRLNPEMQGKLLHKSVTVIKRSRAKWAGKKKVGR